MCLNMPDKYDPPKPGAGDAAQIITRAAVSAVPIVGGPVSELVNAIFGPFVERRREAWMREIADAVRNLEEHKGLTIEDLLSNEVFGDTVLQATQIALRTSQDEKREALRNAALNAALPTAPDQSLQQMFLTFIDTLTVWHIRVLRLFDNPRQVTAILGRRWPSLLMAGMGTILENAYPELGGKRSFYDQVWRDLWQRGLVNTESLHVTMSEDGLEARRSTDLGRLFIDFITAPE
jgi:hypothetical protein